MNLQQDNFGPDFAHSLIAKKNIREDYSLQSSIFSKMKKECETISISSKVKEAREMYLL